MKIKTSRPVQSANIAGILQRAVLGSMCALVAVTVPMNAQTLPQQFVPFKDFLASTQSASSTDYVGLHANQVQDAAAFETMRQHILTMYQGAQVNHSFVLDSSQFDCIPVEQQPTVRILGLKSIAPQPPQSMLAPLSSPGNDAAAPKSASQLDPAKPFDEFGNSVACEAGTIPMRRLTLDEMTRFPTLQQFFQKGPNGAGRAPGSDLANPQVAATHKYSFTYQNVNNLGGNSNLNLWSPYVNTSAGEVFSLSQEWYVGGSGTGLPGEQTAEVGWQNYPSKYGSQSSRLFIYWTADGYNTTGCYNLDCAAFVQVADNGDLGAGFSNYSAFGGAQYEFTAEYYLYESNWWLAIQGTWIGYYPGSVYHGGQLASHATEIEYGTEGVGTTLWPAEGSGDWSTTGFGYAAYQRNLFYLNTSAAGIWDTLTPQDPSPKCYSISGPYSSTSSGWTVYFYEGGPGGSGC
ncbi:MAG: neprosin family prolyl endopeptidase [Bryobacteraceae bacterium]